MTLAVLRLQGFSNATGAEQSIPGMAVLFSFMSTVLLGNSFFKEHDWHTWDRLRSSPIFAIEIVLGKCLPVLGVSLLQLAVIWSVGLGFYKLKLHGTLLAIAIVTICLSWATLGLGMVLVSLCRTIDQLGIIANMGSLILGGLSGAFTPLNLHTTLGSLAQFSPLYWALHAYHIVIFDSSDLADIALPCSLLIAFGFVGFIIAASKFRVTDVKIGRS